LQTDKTKEAKMITRNALVAWVAIALTSTACQPPAQEVRPLSEEDVAAIHNFFEVHTQNVLASDWAADAALRTEDAVRLPPNGAAIRGRAAIQAALAQVDTVLDYTMSAVELDGRGDLAYAWVAYSLTSVLQGSVEPIRDTGKALVILQKQPDGSWMFHRVIWNSDEPPPQDVAETET
jgi:ketosteroid isomerase-like protein